MCDRPDFIGVNGGPFLVLIGPILFLLDFFI